MRSKPGRKPGAIILVTIPLLFRMRPIHCGTGRPRMTTLVYEPPGVASPHLSLSRWTGLSLPMIMTAPRAGTSAMKGRIRSPSSHLV